jgi:hypothetical protein
LSTDRAPVIKLICSTFQPWLCITVLMAKYKRSRPCYPRVGGPLRAHAAFHIVSCVRFRYCISLNSDVISSHIYSLEAFLA